MEAPSGTPDALVISQDEDAEIRVQPVTQGGIRHLDIRIWRRGPSGFAPTRDALMLDRADLEAVRQGIVELLEASEGGRQVARIVLDSGAGRRLRAETEPFGTRYVAHLGFWQRARDSWRPDGDGMALLADRLSPLQSLLLRYEPWMNEKPATELPQAVAEVHRSAQDPWPAPGADWLTVESNGVALHPRGIRITCTLEEQEERHWLTVRQWRREDSLWIPEAVSLVLGIEHLDDLLDCLRGMLNRQENEQVSTEITDADGSALRVCIDDKEMLRVEQRLPSRAGAAHGFEPRLALPAEYLPRLGRALAHSWSLLLVRSSDAERDQLQARHAERQAAKQTDERLETTQEIPAVQAVESPQESTPPVPRTIGSVVYFGEESDYPGTIIPQEGQVRLIVEGYLLPRGITLPIDIVARVLTGLEDLYALQLTQPRLAPMLLCDRPDCAVYARVGTTTRPEAIELRVWSSPRASEAITFDRVYLPEVIEGLRHALRALGQPEPLPTVSFVTAQRTHPPAPPAPPPPEEPVAEVPQPEPEPELEPALPPSPTPTRWPVAELEIGNLVIKLALEELGQAQSLSIRWDGQTLTIGMHYLEEMLSDVRALYYDALRGRRGTTMTVGDAPSIAIGIHNEGTALYIELRCQDDQHPVRLSFPATEIPAFLNAARGALELSNTLQEEH